MNSIDLKQYRKEKGITIDQACIIIGVPRRTYIRYENELNYGEELKRERMIEKLKEELEITENKGILTIEQIKNIVSTVFSPYAEQISFCYLFGSYAKGYAKDTSDIDLCIKTSLSGFAFVNLIGQLSESLHKKVDLLKINDMANNIDLIEEIMKDGIRIYG